MNTSSFKNKLLKYLIILGFLNFGNIFCISPKLIESYTPVKLIEEISYPVSITPKFIVTETKLILELTNPSYTVGSIMDYDRDLFYNEFNVDTGREVLVALTLGINIPIIITEYVYYTLTYPRHYKRYRRAFVPDQGFKGASISSDRIPIEISGLKIENLESDSSIQLAIEIDSLYRDVYSFKSYNQNTEYTISYNICKDFIIRKIYSVQVSKCNIPLKNINISEIVSAISKSKAGAALLNKISGSGR